MKKIIILAIFLPFIAHSQTTSDSFGLDCTATPEIAPDHISLKEIKRSNNLIRKIGSVRRANGTYIVIKGRILDEECTPVPNAFVKIWQTDSKGKYEDSYSLNSKWDALDKDFDENFAYSGTAQTDNLGIFNFITILPVSNDKNTAPHVNFKIKHDNFADLSTMMFFNKHPKNNNDKALKKLSPEKQNRLLAKGSKLDPSDQLEGRIYNFNIVLKGLNKYKGY